VGGEPLQRTRRFITNVSAWDIPGSDAIEVRSNVLLSFTRQSEPTVLVTAQRQDRLVPHESTWRLARRRALLDQNILELTHMRVII
jgi:3-phenylpropionate/cinnamic acid dioxygenase small subunit